MAVSVDVGSSPLCDADVATTCSRIQSRMRGTLMLSKGMASASLRGKHCTTRVAKNLLAIDTRIDRVNAEPRELVEFHVRDVVLKLILLV